MTKSKEGWECIILWEGHNMHWMNEENNEINRTRTNLEAPKTALSYLKDQILLNN